MRPRSGGAVGATALAAARRGAAEGSATPTRALLPASGARSQPQGHAGTSEGFALRSSAGACAAPADSERWVPPAGPRLPASTRAGQGASAAHRKLISSGAATPEDRNDTPAA